MSFVCMLRACQLVLGWIDVSPDVTPAPARSTGHVPGTPVPQDAPPTRSHDKSLITDNYKPYGVGYTGRKG
jgi:hypothetical protein